MPQDKVDRIKVIGIVSNRDIFYKKNTENSVKNLYYSIPNMIVDNIKNHPCIMIPYQLNFIDYYINLIDGLILIGSDHNIPPNLYGDEKKFEMKFCEEKSHFEITFLKKFLTTNKPVLGICAGMQVMNVVQNGTLYQDIHQELNLNHEYGQMNIGSHKIYISEHSHLKAIFNEQIVSINSYHNQAIKELGNDLIISGIAEDNIIEAIELKNHKFCLGVQWHPEFNAHAKDKVIFDYFTNYL